MSVVWKAILLWLDSWPAGFDEPDERLAEMDEDADHSNNEQKEKKFEKNDHALFRKWVLVVNTHWGCFAARRLLSLKLSNHTLNLFDVPPMVFDD